ncbi:MAG: insulinase family protein [Saprospiraceae bacterium]|nr:insulinase family protein [Saprospiraceae bacterium]
MEKANTKPYHRFVLNNGLTVIGVPDQNTRLIGVCVLYKVGSRDEDPNKTGIAHLFEHLMFSNSGKGIDFDNILQMAGAESNAFTTPDTTQYYNIAPDACLELLIQMEAIRMEGFKVSKKDFLTQQKVVIEEFSENYLNNPYGLFSHWLMDLAYTQHPYKWPVIGKSIEQIAGLRFEDASEFYHQYYHPSNAILVVSGHFEEKNLLRFAEKYFGNIHEGQKNNKIYPQEPVPMHKKEKTVLGIFPEDALYIAWPSPGRMSNEFYALDMATDILSDGRSSLLYSRLKKEKMLFSNIDCYLTATTDPGLIILEGKRTEGVSRATALQEIRILLDQLVEEGISDHTWEKYLNKNESAYYFSQQGVINQALNYSYSEWLGDPDLVMHEFERYRALDKAQVIQAIRENFSDEKASFLFLENKLA